MRQQAHEADIRLEDHRQVEVRRQGAHDRERDRHPQPRLTPQHHRAR